MRTVMRWVQLFDISVKELKKYLKSFTKRVFKWIRHKLTDLENYLLKKIDKIGQKANEKLQTRLPIEEKNDDIIVL